MFLISDLFEVERHQNPYWATHFAFWNCHSRHQVRYGPRWSFCAIEHSHEPTTGCPSCQRAAAAVFYLEKTIHHSCRRDASISLASLAI